MTRETNDQKGLSEMDIHITLTGTSELLMHNERLVNPFDPIVQQMKELTSKRKKTEDDLLALSRLEFEGGLYMDEAGPMIPTYNIKRSFIEGGRLHKLGKHVERAFSPRQATASLEYSGPRDIDAMWKAGMRDIRGVRVGTSKVLRCRPRFESGWTATFLAFVDTTVLNLEELRMVADRAGEMCGLCDYRGRFGRYVATIDVMATT